MKKHLVFKMTYSSPLMVSPYPLPSLALPFPVVSSPLALLQSVKQLGRIPCRRLCLEQSSLKKHKFLAAFENLLKSHRTQEAYSDTVFHSTTVSSLMSNQLHTLFFLPFLNLGTYLSFNVLCIMYALIGSFICCLSILECRLYKSTDCFLH